MYLHLLLLLLQYVFLLQGMSTLSAFKQRHLLLLPFLRLLCCASINKDAACPRGLPCLPATAKASGMLLNIKSSSGASTNVVSIWHTQLCIP
jgi:hypothetical protein